MYPSLVTVLIGSWPSPRKRVLNRGLPLDPDLSSDYDRTVFPKESGMYHADKAVSPPQRGPRRCGGLEGAPAPATSQRSATARRRAGPSTTWSPSASSAQTSRRCGRTTAGPRSSAGSRSRAPSRNTAASGSPSPSGRRARGSTRSAWTRGNEEGGHGSEPLRGCHSLERTGVCLYRTRAIVTDDRHHVPSVVPSTLHPRSRPTNDEHSRRLATERPRNAAHPKRDTPNQPRHYTEPQQEP